MINLIPKTTLIILVLLILNSSLNVLSPDKRECLLYRKEKIASVIVVWLVVYSTIYRQTMKSCFMDSVIFWFGWWEHWEVSRGLHNQVRLGISIKLIWCDLASRAGLGSLLKKAFSKTVGTHDNTHTKTHMGIYKQTMCVETRHCLCRLEVGMRASW